MSSHSFSVKGYAGIKIAALKVLSIISMGLAFVAEFLNVKYASDDSAIPSYFPYGRWIFLVCALLFACFIWNKPKLTVIPLAGYIGYFIWKAFYLTGAHLILCIILYSLLPVLYVLAVYKKRKAFLWLTFTAFAIPFASHLVRVFNNFLSNPLVAGFVGAVTEKFPGYRNYINHDISVYGELAMLFIMLGSALFVLSAIAELKKHKNN